MRLVVMAAGFPAAYHLCPLATVQEKRKDVRSNALAMGSLTAPLDP
jgi:hypothetical protein